MPTNATFRQMALALPDAEEQPHFNLASFRVKKKIFATLWEADRKAMLKLTPALQSVYCAYNNTIFYPVAGGWGAKGATFVQLEKVTTTVLAEALRAAYDEVTKKRVHLPWPYAAYLLNHSSAGV